MDVRATYRNHFAKVLYFIVALYGFTKPAWAANEVPQSFTLDGQLNQAGTSNPLLDTNAKITIQIMDPSKTCLLYEEEQFVNTVSSNGYFSIQVGSVTGNAKRTINDPGRSMVQIYQNTVGMTANNVPGQTCTASTYTPAANDSRFFRMIVTPSTTMIADTMSPDTEMNSVPSALVAQTIQGYSASQLLILGAGDLTQANLQTVFATGNAAKLNTLLSVDPSNYVVKNATSGLIGLPSGSGVPAGVQNGDIWYDAGVLKYYNGSVQTIGTGTAPGDATYAAKGLVQFDTNAATSGISVASGIAKLATSGVTAASYGSATQVPTITVDAFGRITAAANTNISLDASAISAGTLPIARGGTNSSTTLNNNRIMVSSGGAIVEAAALTNGQLLIGSTGAAPVAASLTAGAGISITPGAGSISIAATGGGGDFYKDGSVAMTGTLKMGGNTVYGNSTASGNLTLESTSDATKGYVLMQPNGGSVGIGTATPSAKLDVKGDFAMSGSTSGAVKFAVPAAAGSATYTWPAAAPGSNMFLQSNSSGTLSWAAAGAGDALTTNPLSQFAATTSAQLAGVLSDETGTGAAVFGTSPTIATPVITTNATVPMLIGGTGTTSTLTYKTTTGVGAAGADHIFQVGNNGGTEAMRILNSGNVGIGTNNPSEKLDVKGTIAISGSTSGAVKFAVPAAAGSATYTWPAAAPGSNMVLQSDNTGALSWVTDATGSAGLTHFTESVNSSAPNATVPVVRLVATNAATNVDIALTPKGTGSLLAQIPDSTSTAGDKRGDNAVDWQRTRSVASQVASGSGSIIVGGSHNTASGINSVAGGYGNTVSGNTATGFGTTNTVSGYAATGVGSGNTVSGYYGFAAGNTVTAEARSQVTFGEFNMPKGSESASSWVSTDPLFVIGNGTGSGASRSTAVMVLKNGNTGIGTTSPSAKLDVKGNFAMSGSTSGAVTFAVPAAAGSATYTWPAAAPGSNMFLQSNSSGTLSWAAAGAGDALTTNPLSQFAATTSAQLAGVLSDETGSGAAVFGTSPTIATPTFTTNITSPMVIGGTGTTSTLTYKTTTGVGTTGADHIFQVGNNGATEAMRILNSGSVGIGTSSTTAKLDVKGNFAISGATSGAVTFAVPAAAGSATYTWPAAAPASNMVLQSDNTGALSWVSAASGTGDFLANGTIPMTGAFQAATGAAATPSITFDGDEDTGFYNYAANGISLATGGTERVRFGNNGSITAQTAYYLLGSSNTAASPTFSFAADTNTGIFPAAADELGFTTAGNERLRVDASGNVGIATTSPQNSLDVSGNFLRIGADSALTTRTNNTVKLGGVVGQHYTNAEEPVGIIGYGTGATENEIYFGGGNSSVNAATLIRFLTAATPTTTTGTERMRIDSSGNVGINTTSSGAKLDVKGNVSISGATSGAVTFAVPAAAGSATYTWPAAAPASNMVLQSDNTGALSWVTDATGAGGLTNFTESVNTTAPNATVPVVRLIATNAATDVDVALSPKGAGALTAQVADGTTAGGNKRGAGAVDWQMTRSNANQVAEYTASVIGGGQNNRVTGMYGAVVGGQTNAVAGSSFIGGGSGNTITQTYAVIGGGQNNTVSNAANTHGAILGGSSNTVSASMGVVVGGNSNTVTGQRGIAGGTNSTADSYNQITFGAYNMPKGSETTSSWVTTDPLFVIGNGTGSGASRSTAFMVLKNGNTGIGTESPTAKLDVVGPGYTHVRFKSNGTTDPASMVTIEGADSSGRAMLSFNKPSAFAVGFATQDYSGTLGLAFHTDNNINNTPSMFLTTTGNVGIGTGTGTPSAKLDVKGNFAMSGSTSGAVTFAVPAAAGSATYTWPAAAPGSNMLLQSDNTGALSWVSAGGGAATSATSTAQFVINSDSDNSGSDGGVYFQKNGSTVASISNAGRMLANAGDLANPGLSFHTDQNTGVGTLTADTVSIIGGGIEGLRVNTVASGVNYVAITPAVTTASPVIGSAGTDTNIDLTFTPKGTGNTIFSSGNVGVGTTSAPSAKLDVKGTFAMSGSTSGSVKFAVPAAAGSATYTWPAAAPGSNMLLQSDNTGALSWVAGGGSGDFKADGSVPMTGAMTVVAGNATTPGVVFNNDADSGLYSPAAGNVHVIRNGTDILKLGHQYIGYLNAGGVVTATANATALPTFSWSGDEDTGMYKPAANEIGFSTNATEKMRITSAGNVGIGTNAPTAKLDVAATSTITTGTAWGLNTYLEVDPSANSTADYRNYFSSGVKAGNTRDINSVVAAITSEVVHEGTGAVSTMYGTSSSVLKASTGNIADAYGLHSVIENTNATGTITNGYGLYIAPFVRTGAITNSYGVYVADSTAKNYFAGNVGIGTTGATSNLEVQSAITGAYDVTALTPTMVIRNQNNSSAASQYAALRFHVNAQDGGGANAYGTISVIQTAHNSNASQMAFSVRSGAGAHVESMRIDAVGNVGIGTTAPGQKLEVNGNVLASAFLYSSDVRLKKDITPIENSLEKLLTLNTVNFDWKSPKSEEEKRKQLGLIAQDVQKVYPEAVHQGKDGWLRVNYSALVAPLIDGLREVYKKVVGIEEQQVALENKVKELETKNAELELRLQRIEQGLKNRQPASQ